MSYFRFLIYVISYGIYLSLSDYSMILSWSIHVAANGIIFLVELYSYIYIYIRHILFIQSSVDGTFRLSPCLGYSKWCCYEHSSACIFWNCSFVWIYAQE